MMGYDVVAMLSRLGRRTAFVGRVGLDGHGQMLRDAVAARGIGTEHVRCIVHVVRNTFDMWLQRQENLRE